jgi:hypothetical protein
MAIGTVNYPQPVMINGFPCKNCTEVDEAKANIDPKHPAAGPYGVDANADPTLAGKQAGSKNGAVTFGGALANTGNAGLSSAAEPPSSPRGSQLNFSV